MRQGKVGGQDVFEQVTTVGSWSLIPSGNSGSQCRTCISELSHYRMEVTEGLNYQLLLVLV